MRKFKTKDVFKLARILKHADALDVFKQAYAIKPQNDTPEELERVQEQRGEIIIMGMFNLADAQTEEAIYEFLGDVYGMTPDGVGELDLDEQIEKITKLMKENNFESFFSKVQGVAQSMS